MPKKAKKGKGKGKGKGKKGKKKSSKKFTDSAQATANSRLWEARLEATEKSRLEYRENAKRLALENESLQNHMYQSERDTIDVVTFLKKEDQSKEDLIARLSKQLKDTKRETRKEKQQIIDEFSQRINQLEDSLNEKTNEVKMMQSELKLVKEFRRKRGQMQKELDEIKEEMFITSKEHKATLQRMEHKFFEEKIRLQQEASQKIAELAERAHTEAIANLDETTRSVYKENVRLSEALNYHVKEANELKKAKEALEEESGGLRGDKDLNTQLVEGKIIECKRQKHQIKELQEKVRTLEKSLSHVVREFETEREIILKKTDIETEASRVEIAKLLRTVDMKTKEMNKVKKLAKNILDQRTQVERYFLEALEQVKLEIVANRAQYRQDAAAMYNKKMLDAHAGKGSFPKIRTFNKSENSTNNVYSDLQAAESWAGIAGQVDISELTWEQKEKVIRLLFAKMNGAKVRVNAPDNLAPIKMQPGVTHTETVKAIEAAPEPDNTFLTQAQLSDGKELNSNTVVPEIGAMDARHETTVT
ncbi:basal body-orientation factor 1-like [Saccoglossus kowalevskii]|uniref:Basal body-orientation factor 1 n=1 Tax=Saccoglossus kowalevskii TaxID=10224 RepID=A0ABM0M705_SACKO|nr:PREDICTED: basal body-orientation factor 1-like [Saccoglossus kowalevskii]